MKNINASEGTMNSNDTNLIQKLEAELHDRQRAHDQYCELAAAALNSLRECRKTVTDNTEAITRLQRAIAALNGEPRRRTKTKAAE